MALIPATVTRPAAGKLYDNCAKVTWGPFTLGDTFAPIDLPMFARRSVQLQGTPGAGATVTIDGSNDGVNFVNLTDLQGAALSFTAAGKLEGIAEQPLWIKPTLAGGDGTTALTVTMMFFGEGQ